MLSHVIDFEFVIKGEMGIDGYVSFLGEFFGIFVLIDFDIVLVFYLFPANKGRNGFSVLVSHENI